MANESLSKQWEDLQDKTRDLNNQLTQLQNEYQVISEEYIVKLGKLFSRYNIPNQKKEKYFKEIRDSRKNLKELLLMEETAVEKGQNYE